MTLHVLYIRPELSFAYSCWTPINFLKSGVKQPSNERSYSVVPCDSINFRICSPTFSDVYKAVEKADTL
ncbi:hypothetical protein HanRHA438_Chr01g0012961 [Helianthus annuus]|nr:hypothetical protein HanRHA438_Chr01g0012961 [Helianthus annuus]